MPVNDPVGDMLTRIRNAQLRGRSSVHSPTSKLRGWVLDVLKDEGFIRDYAHVTGEDGRQQLEIALKYHDGTPVIREVAAGVQARSQGVFRSTRSAVSAAGARNRHRLDVEGRDVGHEGPVGECRRRNHLYGVLRRGGMSRIGKKAVELPDGVTAAVNGQTIEVQGPKGVRSFTATDDVAMAVDGNVVRVVPRGSSKRARQQWGMTRSQVANLVTGVTAGFRKELSISGVGFRARLQDEELVLSLGYSSDIRVQAPQGVTISVPRQTSVVIEGIDQQVVGQVAAEIRAWRKPEPYKGKGISYAGERIFRKEGKKK